MFSFVSLRKQRGGKHCHNYKPRRMREKQRGLWHSATVPDCARAYDCSDSHSGGDSGLICREILPRGTTVQHHVMADGICGYWRAHQRTGHTFNGGVERNCRFRLFTLKRQNTLIWRWLRFLIRSDLKNWSKLPKFTHSKLGIRKSSRESESGHAHYKLQHCRSSDNVSFKFIGRVQWTSGLEMGLSLSSSSSAAAAASSSTTNAITTTITTSFPNSHR